MRKKLKGIVCGVRFGQFYIEAIKKSEKIDLVGILSKGSDKSNKCAEKYHTKLYTKLEELPPDIDIACVVIRSGVLGGEGTALAIGLMNKGIHVVLEQPVHQKDLALCYKTAKQNKVFFVLGDLYPELPSVKKFIALSQGIIEHQNPLYINIDLATQVSFPLVHILNKVLPSLRPSEIQQTIKEDTPFQVISLKIAGTPVVIRAHNQVDLKISDSYLHLFHSITLGVGGGRLSLIDTHGPVTWQPRLVSPDYDFIPADLKQNPTERMLEESNLIIGQPKYPNYQEILTQLWPDAILQDIERIIGLINGSISENQMAKWGQQELLCAQLWHEISNALGYPNNCENPEKEYLPISTIVSSYYQKLSMSKRHEELSKK